MLNFHNQDNCEHLNVNDFKNAVELTDVQSYIGFLI